MELKISKIALIGLVISILGVVLHLLGYKMYSINGISVFPFIMIPIGILISLLGFMKRFR